MFYELLYASPIQLNVVEIMLFTSVISMIKKVPLMKCTDYFQETSLRETERILSLMLAFGFCSRKTKILINNWSFSVN